MNPNFTTRETYLTFVSEWKAAYALLVAATRAQRYSKVNRLEVAGELKAAGEEYAAIKKKEADFAALRLTIPDLGALPDHCRPGVMIEPVRRWSSNRDVANYLLALRKLGKRKAQEQYQAEKAAAARELATA